VYHLTSRSSSRQRIFFTDQDREQFCRTLSGIFARGGAKAIEEAYTKHGYTMKEIGEHLDVHYVTVSRQLKKLEKPVLCDCKT
jgi:DNA-binding MarR family transcriptional regulator